MATLVIKEGVRSIDDRDLFVRPATAADIRGLNVNTVILVGPMRKAIIDAAMTLLEGVANPSLIYAGDK